MAAKERDGLRDEVAYFDNSPDHDMKLLHHEFHMDMPPVDRTQRVTPDEDFAGDCLQDAMLRQPVPRLTAEQERGVGWNPAHI